MGKRGSSVFRLVAINLVVLVALLALLEGGARLLGLDANRAGGIFGARFAPYVMWVGSTMRGEGTIPDLFRNEVLKFQRSTNNWGFRADEDFDWAAKIDKAPNQRVVLLTGGSAAAGAGASSDERTVDAQLEAVLNDAQDIYEYRVINFANGGWVAFQQLVGLMLWGNAYDPDWIVTMDGRNDIAVACAHSEGDGYPMHYHLMQSYIDNYLPHARPDFYRGWLENQIVRFSAVYRWITGKQYVRNTQHVSDLTSGPVVATPTTWADVERQVDFYMRTQQSLLDLFWDANVILSLQPLVHDSKHLKGEGEFAADALREKVRDKPCGLRTYQIGGVFYFYQKVEERLQALAAKRDGENGRTVDAFNTHYLLPEDGEARKPFFLDEAHMHDAGQELVGTFYAMEILVNDFPGREAELRNQLRARMSEIVAKHQGAAGAR